MVAINFHYDLAKRARHLATSVIIINESSTVHIFDDWSSMYLVCQFSLDVSQTLCFLRELVSYQISKKRKYIQKVD